MFYYKNVKGSNKESVISWIVFFRVGIWKFIKVFKFIKFRVLFLEVVIVKFLLILEEFYEFRLLVRGFCFFK